MIELTDALIFDCDGTLADSMPAHFHAWQETLRAHPPLVFTEERFYAWGGRPTIEIARSLVAEFGAAIDPVKLAADKEEMFATRIGDVKPIEKVVALARAGRGTKKMAVASGGRRTIVHATLRQLGIDSWFPVVVTAEDTIRHKPEPDVFLEAACRLGAVPGICTVFEDTDLGIEAARRAGMKFVDVRHL